MVFCAAYGCKSRSYPRGGFSNITERRRFFSFPKSNHQKNRWVSVLKRDNLTVTKHTKLCDLHFLPSDYTSNKKKLKDTAIPLGPHITKEQTAVKIAKERRYEERSKRKQVSQKLIVHLPLS